MRRFLTFVFDTDYGLLVSLGVMALGAAALIVFGIDASPTQASPTFGRIYQIHEELIPAEPRVRCFVLKSEGSDIAALSCVTLPPSCPEPTACPSPSPDPHDHD